MRRFKLHEWILAGLILYGLILRTYKLGGQSLWIDESFTINAALGILKHGYPLMDSGIVYGSQYLATYLAAMSIWIFGLTEFAARLPFALLGTASIYVMYLLVSQLWNSRAGLIAAGLTTFMPLHIAWSRNSRSYMLLFFFMALSLYLLFRCMEEPSRRMLVFLSLSVLGTILSHQFGLILIPAVAFALIFGRKLAAKKLVPLLGLVLASILVALMVFKINTKMFLHWTGSWNYSLYSYWVFLTKNVFFVLSLGCIGMIFVIRKNWRTGAVLGATLVLYFYTICFHIDLLHFRYMFPIYAILIALSAICLESVAEFLSQARSWLDLCLIVVALFSFSFHSLVPHTLYYLEYQTPQPDFRSAYKNITLGDDDIVVSAYPVLSRFYLGRSDYWIPFTLSGKPINESQNNVHTGDKSLGVAELNELVSTKKGWIVIDNLAVRMMRPEFYNAIQNATLVYSEQNDIYSGVYVYRFGH
jgi:4-amino-4-deoxy-L-arabinose transferase-like glycosyltransferase